MFLLQRLSFSSYFVQFFYRFLTQIVLSEYELLAGTRAYMQALKKAVFLYLLGLPSLVHSCPLLTQQPSPKNICVKDREMCEILRKV